jgi:hypothetical protein
VERATATASSLLSIDGLANAAPCPAPLVSPLAGDRLEMDKWRGRWKETRGLLDLLRRNSDGFINKHGTWYR